MAFRTLKTFCLLGLAVLMLVGACSPAEVQAAVTKDDIATLTLDPVTTQTQKPPAADTIGIPWLVGRMALALGVVFGLMWLVLWAAKKYLPQATQKGRGGVIEILATKPLGPRRSLMLVRTHGKTLLIGVTPQSINTLTELEPETEESWHDAALAAGLPPEPPQTRNAERGMRSAE